MGRLLSYAELSSCKGVRFSMSYLLRLEKAGKFPRRVNIGVRAVAWDEDEVERHINEKRAARYRPPADVRPFRRVRRPA